MSSPPPNNPLPTTTTTTTTTADFLKPVTIHQRRKKDTQPSIFQPFSNPTTTPPFPPPPPNSRSQALHHHPPPPQPAAGVIYPVASSGKGFIPKHQQAMVNSSGGYPPRPVAGYAGFNASRPYGFSNSDLSGYPLQQSGAGGGNNAGSGNGNQKVVGQSSVAADYSLRDKNGDDAFVIIRDRKVQVSESTSLYAQCRSWLKNGLTLENQPQYMDCVKSLPKPLPASMVEARKEDDMETEETPEDVSNMSAKDLLQQHVRHAKKVRARLRNKRLQKIERYKDRLALLLPPVADQQPKTDPAS